MIEFQKNNASLSFSEALLKGADGITPHIGANGNWYLDTTDTGKPSRGDKGDKGDKGDPGSDATVDIVTPTAESTATQAASAKAVYDSLPTLKTWTSADVEVTT